MKQLVCITPKHFKYQTVENPFLTKGNAIIKVRNIGICGTDLHAFEGTQPFFNYPRVLGHELAGEIVDIETDAGFKIGEKVTIIPYFNCGNCVACLNYKPNCCTKLNVLGVHSDGGMAEYISVPIYALVHGGGLSFEELAMIEPLAIGRHAVSRAKVQASDIVLVVGAGPIGLGIIAFTKIMGAKVIVMDINTNRLAFAKENLAVSYTINPRTDNIIEKILEMTDGNMPSIIFEATGNQNAINNSFQYIAHGGQFILVGLQKGDIIFSHPEFHKREATLMSSRNATRADFEYVIDCIKKGLVNPTKFITHQVDFEDAKNNFESWINPENNVIKAMVSLK